MRLPLFALLVVALAASALAQDDGSFDGRVVVVSGMGEVRARSDRAVLQVAFETEGETAEDALRQHEDEVERVRQLLTDHGVPDDRVSVDHASVAPAGAMRFPGMGGGGDEGSGYEVGRQLTVEVDDLASVPALVAALSTDSEDDALTVQRRTVNVAYVLANPEPFQREALRKAVTDARARAELIAEMASVTLGEVLDVSEGVAAAGGGELGMFGAMMADAMRQEMGGSGMVEQRVTASVVVTYRIR